MHTPDTSPQASGARTTVRGRYERGEAEKSRLAPSTESGIETALVYHGKVRYRRAVDEALNTGEVIPMRHDVEREVEEEIEMLRSQYGSLVEAHGQSTAVQTAVAAGHAEYLLESFKNAPPAANDESAPRPRKKRFGLRRIWRRN